MHSLPHSYRDEEKYRDMLNTQFLVELMSVMHTSIEANRELIWKRTQIFSAKVEWY